MTTRALHCAQLPLFGDFQTWSAQELRNRDGGAGLVKINGHDSIKVLRWAKGNFWSLATTLPGHAQFHQGAKQVRIL